jgi:hypothetical protein
MRMLPCFLKDGSIWNFPHLASPDHQQSLNHLKHHHFYTDRYAHYNEFLTYLFLKPCQRKNQTSHCNSPAESFICNIFRSVLVFQRVNVRNNVGLSNNNMNRGRTRKQVALCDKYKSQQTLGIRRSPAQQPPSTYTFEIRLLVKVVIWSALANEYEKFGEI